MSHFTPTDLTRVRRIAQRANYDQATVHAIVDQAWICHIAFSLDGQSHCIPTAHWRVGEAIHIHGSNGSRLLRALATGIPACVCITHLDGLVLARSAFNHSMNYRSAMVYGRFAPLTATERSASLDAFMDKVEPGRRAQVRMPDANELAATTVLALPIIEAVAKIRQGPPEDDEADLALPVWAGVWPLETCFGEPITHHASTALA